MINEEKCKGCPFLTEWTKYGYASYPACFHRDSGPKSVNLLSEMDSCPKGK